MTPIDPIVPACWLDNADSGAIVNIWNTKITGRLEGAWNTLSGLTVLRIDGQEWTFGKDQLVILDSFTAERFAADADRRQALVAGSWLFWQPNVFKTLRDGDAEVTA